MEWHIATTIETSLQIMRLIKPKVRYLLPQPRGVAQKTWARQRRQQRYPTALIAPAIAMPSNKWSLQSLYEKARRPLGLQRNQFISTCAQQKQQTVPPQTPERCLPALLTVIVDAADDDGRAAGGGLVVFESTTVAKAAPSLFLKAVTDAIHGSPLERVDAHSTTGLTQFHENN